MRANELIGRALALWWQEMVALLLLNAAWFLLQLLVVTGPPATAVVYALSRRIVNRELWGLSDAAGLLRQLFWPAWRWGALNGAVLLVIGVNFFYFWGETAVHWQLLRLVWGGFLVVWLALNFYYWPFWLAQTDQSMKTTYLNCLRLFLLHPWLALAVVIFAALLTVISFLTTLPAALALVCWLALLATTAVQASIEEK